VDSRRSSLSYVSHLIGRNVCNAFPIKVIKEFHASLAQCIEQGYGFLGIVPYRTRLFALRQLDNRRPSRRFLSGCAVALFVFFKVVDVVEMDDASVSSLCNPLMCNSNPLQFPMSDSALLFLPLKLRFNCSRGRECSIYPPVHGPPHVDLQQTHVDRKCKFPAVRCRT